MPTHRPVPDDTPVRRALRILAVTETDMEKYLREEHTAMISGARIAMDAARNLWPLEKDHIPFPARGAIERAHNLLEDAYEVLDDVSTHFHGELMHAALMGHDVESKLQELEQEHGIEPFAQQTAPTEEPQQAADEPTQAEGEHPAGDQPIEGEQPPA